MNELPGTHGQFALVSVYCDDTHYRSPMRRRRTCKEPGCPRFVVAKGCCSACYRRTRRVTMSKQSCKSPGCNYPRDAKSRAGFCTWCRCELVGQDAPALPKPAPKKPMRKKLKKSKP